MTSSRINPLASLGALSVGAPDIDPSNTRRWLRLARENNVFNVEVKFIVNGREVSPDEWADDLQSAMLESLKESITARLQDVRCPEHNQYPTIEMEGASLGTLEAKVYGCCEKLRDAATKALSA